MRNQVVLFCLLVLPFQLIFSQSTAPKVRKPLKVGVSITANQYWGDLIESETRFLRVQPGVNFSLQLAGTSALQLQVNAGLGRFSEQFDATTSDAQASSNQANSFVETRFGYGELRARYRFFKRKRFQPFLFVGAGLVAFSPKDGQGRFLKDEADSRNQGETYHTLIPQVPVGLGFEYYVTDRVSLESSILMRLIPTDYLDNQGELGTRNGNDRIYSLSLGMNIQLGPSPEEQQTLQVIDTVLTAVPSQLAEQDSQPVVPPDTASHHTPIVVKEIPSREAAESISSPIFSSERRRLLRLAIEREEFLFHQISENEDINVLSERYKVPIEMIQELNFLRSTELKLGSYLRIPDPNLSQSSE